MDRTAAPHARQPERIDAGAASEAALSQRPRAASHGGRRSGSSAWLGRVPGWAWAALAYLAAAVGVWWHVWMSGPGSTVTCPCGDPASFVWFIAWPAYALSHGHSLLFTTAVHAPAGMNLLDNTSVLAIGVALAPVTWLAGPVFSLNVALTAAPALSALSAYGALRRALRVSRPAAFLGGLLFGFSPFVIRNETLAHLQASFLALPPLVFLCLYELLVTQRGTWWRWGLLLGLCVAGQFFIGPEILTVMAFMTAVALLAMVLAALRRKGRISAALPFAWRGLLVGGVVAAGLLAYPLWFAMTGPEHINGPVWFHAHANGLLAVLLPVARPLALRRGWLIAGYRGALGSGEGYLGIPALVVLGLALYFVRRPLVKLAAAITVLAVWLSLGAVRTPVWEGGEPSLLWLPWKLFAGLPTLNKLAPASFSVVSSWFTVVAGVLLVDHLLSRRPARAAGPGAVQPEQEGAGEAAASGAREAQGHPVRRWAAWTTAPRVAGAAVTAALIVPWLAAWPLPLATMPVPNSPWADRQGAHLPARSVVLFYPFPATYQDQSLIWQAEQGMRFSIVGGRGIVAVANGTADHGFTPGTPEGIMSALTTASVPHYDLKLPPPPTTADVQAFRRDLRYWGVTTVVMTRGGRDPAYARQWLTTMLGTAPQRQSDAWVWQDVQRLISRGSSG